MAKQQASVVPGPESDVHDEPHISGRRVTVRRIHALVDERGLSHESVAAQLELDPSDVDAALSYYGSNPEEMARVEARHERAVADAKRRSRTDPAE